MYSEVRDKAVSCNKNREEGKGGEGRERIKSKGDGVAYQGEGCISGEQRARRG